LRFARNVSWNLLGQIGVSLVNFFAIPYLVSRLGLEGYGLYILLHACAGYLQVLSFGSGAAVLKYAAQFQAARARLGLRDTLVYSSAIHVFGALAGGVLLGVGAPFCLTRIFHVPGSLLASGTFVLRCAAAGAVCAALIQLSLAVLQGLQRFGWQNLLVFVQNTLMALGAVALLAQGWGLSGVAAWYVLVSLVICLLALAVAGRLLRPASAYPPGEGLAFRKFAAFSLGAWFGPLAWIVVYQFDKIFLARFAALSGLTLYAVPAGLLQRLQVIPATISVVVLPMMSELQGPEAEETLRRIYLRSVKFVLWALLPALVLLFALMPQFLGLWLGGEFGGRSVWPARLLVVSQFFFLLCAIPNALVSSRDKPWLMSAVAWAQAALSLLAWQVLIPRYNLLGVALGSLLAQALPALAYLFFVHRRVLGIPWKLYFSESLYSPLVSAGLLLALVFPIHASASSWPRLVALCVGGCLLYYGSTWHFLGSEDRALFRKFAGFRAEPAPGGGS